MAKSDEKWRLYLVINNNNGSTAKSVCSVNAEDNQIGENNANY